MSYKQQILIIFPIIHSEIDAKLPLSLDNSDFTPSLTDNLFLLGQA